jgi:hypothetical protein
MEETCHELSGVVVHARCQTFALFVLIGIVVAALAEDQIIHSRESIMD